MKRVHVIGRKNHGKTTLVTELVSWWTSQGFRVGTIKHTHHRHELDTPGKDSHRHREAGAEVVGILSPEMNAVFWRPAEARETDPAYDSFGPLYAECDMVLVEGDSQTQVAKIEVWRAERGTRPIAEVDPLVLALVTDDPIDIGVPVLARSDVSVLAAWLQQRVFAATSRDDAH